MTKIQKTSKWLAQKNGESKSIPPNSPRLSKRRPTETAPQNLRSLILRNNFTTHIVTAVRANGVRLNHFVAIGTSNRLNGLFKIVRTTGASTGVALLSLRNCHLKNLPKLTSLKLNTDAHDRIRKTPRATDALLNTSARRHFISKRQSRPIRRGSDLVYKRRRRRLIRKSLRHFKSKGLFRQPTPINFT